MLALDLLEGIDVMLEPYVPDTFRRKGELSRMDNRMGNTRSMGCDIGSIAWDFLH